MTSTIVVRCRSWFFLFVCVTMLCSPTMRLGPKLLIGAFSPTTTTTSRSILPIRWTRGRMCLTSTLLQSSSSSISSSADDDENDDNDYEEDTIYALSSGGLSSSSIGQATAVAIIRMTGPQSHSILSSLLANKSSVPPPRMASLRNLYDAQGNALDQALVLRFDAPKSFTGEDVVELHCHGSRAVVNGVLSTLGRRRTRKSTSSTAPAAGARLAERGEFTQRAFRNGKLNLLQVEALADLLASETSTQRQLALRQLDGSSEQVYQEWRVRLVKGLAHAEAVIDFGDDERLDDNDDDDDDDDDDDIAQWNVWGSVGQQISSLRKDMQHHLEDNRRGELMREGVRVAIVGPPNAGKSSLFNLLAKRDAAIVSPIAGTTRDVLELTLDLGGVKCLLSDTAGVRESSNDVIEQEGMKRARNVAKQADIVVAMVDAIEPNTGVPVLEEVLTMMDDETDAPTSRNILLALNKLDLYDKEKESAAIYSLPEELTSQLGGVYPISCETSDGIDSFLEALTNTALARVSSNDDDDSDSNEKEGAIITRARHRQHVEAAVEALFRFEALSQQGTMAVDMAAEELRLATSELGRITGAVDVEDVLDVLFADFCIGK